jgi:ADP-ribosyl-[dinitrogen reductase] hydrolase
MKPETNISRKDQILGGLWGSLVGDALGVPVEFMDRAEVQSDPVTEMRGFGTHRQPAGTWSDDSSLLLCSTESLIRHEFDTGDMGKRFVRWYQEEIWTPHGKTFDVGVATASALTRIANGMRAEVAGGDDQFSNGNGSLMRILPVSLRFADCPIKQAMDRVHRASALTHRHPRSQMACGLFTLVVRELLNGNNTSSSYDAGLSAFRKFYESDPWWSAEWDYFQLLLAGDLARRPESEIDSGGYVLNTLPASLWCLLTTQNFRDCVLKAVNLGGDTDTTGCVAGGLAGVAYGIKSIPPDWMRQLARRGDVDCLFREFADLCERRAENSHIM